MNFLKVWINPFSALLKLFWPSKLEKVRIFKYGKWYIIWKQILCWFKIAIEISPKTKYLLPLTRFPALRNEVWKNCQCLLIFFVLQNISILFFVLFFSYDIDIKRHAMTDKIHVLNQIIFINILYCESGIKKKVLGGFKSGKQNVNNLVTWTSCMIRGEYIFSHFFVKYLH